MDRKKKKLAVNCAVCDMSGVSEKTLESYESIRVRAATAITSEEAEQRMADYAVQVESANTFTLPAGADGVQMSTQNGSFTIRAGQKPQRPTFLIVNGSLTIERGAEEALSGYVGITVNGSVTYPDSIAGSLPSMQVNGSSESYPAGAVVLKRTFLMDKTFALRAENRLYYAGGRIVIVAPDVDMAAIAAAGATFQTPKAILAEQYARDAIKLFPPETDVEIVPDGTTFSKENVTLDENAVRRCGGKLYVRGNVSIPESAGEALGRMTYLHITGSVKLPEELMDAFLAIGATYGSLFTVRGREITDRVVLTIDAHLLEQNPKGLTVNDCVTVKLDPAISPEMIRERLVLSDCVDVRCTKEQRSAVEQIAEDCVQIRSEGGVMDAVRGLVGKMPGAGGDGEDGDDADTRTINAVFYKL